MKFKLGDLSKCPACGGELVFGGRVWWHTSNKKGLHFSEPIPPNNRIQRIAPTRQRNPIAPMWRNR